MIPANINVQLDEVAIRDYIREQLDNQINHELLLVDVKKLAELLSMSVRFIEDEFLHDPRVKIYEVRKNKKRWFWYKEIIEAISQIISEDW